MSAQKYLENRFPESAWDFNSKETQAQLRPSSLVVLMEDYHKHQINLSLGDIIQSGEHKCKFYVNANWTGYSRCECGEKHKSPDV